ncbi:MAG: hypothetical protein ABIN69_14340 [Aestuariivirga sp.]
MPRKPNGGKNGRPLKATRPVLTRDQTAYVVAKIANPALRDSELAQQLKVTRQAVGKWKGLPHITNEIKKRLSAIRTAEIAAEVARLFALDDAEIKKQIDSETSEVGRIVRNRKVYLQSMIENGWTGPTTLPGGDEIFHTKEAYLEALMLKENSVPYDDVVTVRKNMKKLK